MDLSSSSLDLGEAPYPARKKTAPGGGKGDFLAARFFQQKALPRKNTGQGFLYRKAKPLQVFFRIPAKKGAAEASLRTWHRLILYRANLFETRYRIQFCWRSTKIKKKEETQELFIL